MNTIEKNYAKALTIFIVGVSVFYLIIGIALYGVYTIDEGPVAKPSEWKEKENKNGRKN